jgi:site-specific DNA recombinase
MMLKRARQGRIDVVVFWKLDRFCRSLKDLVTTAERLSDYDVSLQSVTEYIDTTTPVGRFNFRNLASAAELESDLTGQRAQMGMYGLAREGKWPNASPPLGYTRNDDGTLELCDRERTLVERIFRLYLETKSMPEVAYQLNSDGERTNNGGEWCRQSVKRILSNELYVGRYCVAEFETRIEEYRLIEDPLFDAVTNVRYRFQYSKERMSHGRKQSKADQVKAAYLKALPQD